jgi:hypothetical protein
MTETEPSTDPADYRCPRCHAPVGARCGVLQRVKIRHPHSDRIDTMIRANDRWTKAGRCPTPPEPEPVPPESPPPVRRPSEQPETDTAPKARAVFFGDHW